MRRTAFLFAFALSGCTPMQWVRPGASAEDFNQDIAQCRQDAWREAQWRSFMYRPFGPVVAFDRFGRRHVLLYSPFGDPFGDPFIEESRLTHFCMRAKGYALVPIEPKK
jgi:hypothetical protein